MGYRRYAACRSPIMLGFEAPKELIACQDGLRPDIQSSHKPNRLDLEKPCIAVTDNVLGQNRAKNAFELTVTKVEGSWQSPCAVAELMEHLA